MDTWRNLFSSIYHNRFIDIIIKAARNISHGQIFDENFLMMIATFGAFGVKEFEEAVAVMLFYQVGELFSGICGGKSRQPYQR